MTPQKNDLDDDDDDDDERQRKKNPMNATIDGTPFSVIMNQAVKLKTARMAPLRSRYDKYAKFYQNSIFPHADVIRARNDDDDDDSTNNGGGAFARRMTAAMRMKEEGNDNFRNGFFDEAYSKYERALVVFKYLENTNPSWKNEGIKDDFIKEVFYVGRGQKQKQEVINFLITCYSNIANVCIKTKDYQTAVRACDETLSLDARNAKALYLRSRARTVPKSSGATEYDLAVTDLKLAAKCHPRDVTIRKELKRLREVLRTGRDEDKKTFGGLFRKDGGGGGGADDNDDDDVKNRDDGGGTTAIANSKNNNSSTQNRKSSAGTGTTTAAVVAKRSKRSRNEGEIDFAGLTHRQKQYEAFLARKNNNDETKKGTRRSDPTPPKTIPQRKSLKPRDEMRFQQRRSSSSTTPRRHRPPPTPKKASTLDEKSGAVVVADLNFRSPTTEMKKDAAANGIDLSDPRVIELLERLQKLHRDGGGEMKNVSAWDVRDCINERARIGAESIVDGMSSKHVGGALKALRVRHSFFASLEEKKRLLVNAMIAKREEGDVGEEEDDGAVDETDGDETSSKSPGLLGTLLCLVVVLWYIRW
eukprot:CAMPEP_0172481730 /NCGR_PEP_ID=MMETSP1066-20121228/7818_1 /TAXON_ID=671091 /ORGANISM="Coscinodiscus wailesii, Strain CCMP2513" /LENGTH=586 /DNA_ID=CAMNT_0013244297 /DNA_START=95 /DNA_END=1852 /DNA_ORIENTATION=+